MVNDDFQCADYRKQTIVPDDESEENDMDVSEYKDE